jgi:hypothetical protein
MSTDNERRFFVIDVELLRARNAVKRFELTRLEPTHAIVRDNDPRPTKGKYEPPHQFNSRLRAWLRRNP